MAGKFLLLLGAIAAVAGLFMPLFTSDSANYELAASLGQPVDISLFTVITNPPEEMELDSEHKSALTIAAAPCAALALVAILGLLARYGRGVAVLGLLVGVAGLFLSYTMYSAAADQEVLQPGMGILLMLGGTGVGALAGVVGLIAPQKKKEDGKDKKKKKDKK